MKSRIVPIILAIAILTALCGCSKPAKYRNDVPVADLAGSVADTLGPENFATMQESYVTGAMKLDLSLFSEYDVRINAYGANIDEFGIFKAADGVSAEDALAEVDNYLKFRLDTWMEEYMPEEKPKLENAKTRSAGNYVMYAILSEEDRDKAFEAFDSGLKTED